MGKKLVRSSFTLPSEMLDDLAYISHRVGVSRSALLADLSGEPLRDLRGMLEQVPENPTPADVVRLRGKSVDLAEQRLASLRSLEDDLFAANGG